MKIGILTFHEIYNPGAYLQVYSTIKILEEMGHEAVIINYTSPAHRFHPWNKLFRHPQILIHFRDWLESFGRNRAFTECQKYLNKTICFETREKVSSVRFDAVVVGADIVWNYQSPHLGQDSIYFGEGLNAGRLIAFAPSCGAVDLSQPIPEFVRKGLAGFKNIAVRDNKTADLVEKLIELRPKVIVDPTFSLNINSLPEVHEYKNDYLLVYALKGVINSTTQKAIIDFAIKKNLKTVAVCYRHNWVDENHIFANPFEWLGRIRCARYIFTNTFHGTIFALKLGKSFTTKYNPYIESKTRPFMESLGRQDRIWDGKDDLTDILEAPWDISSTHRAMESMANRAKAYLENALT